MVKKQEEVEMEVWAHWQVKYSTVVVVIIIIIIFFVCFCILQGEQQ